MSKQEHGLVYKYFNTMVKYNPNTLAYKFLFGEDFQLHSEVLQMALIFLFEFGYKRYQNKPIFISLLESGLSIGIYYLVYEEITKYINTEAGYSELISASALTSLLSNIINSLIVNKTIPNIKENTKAILIDFALIAISGFISIKFDELTDFLPFTSTQKQEVFVLTIFVLVGLFEIWRYLPMI